MIFTPEKIRETAADIKRQMLANLETAAGDKPAACKLFLEQHGVACKFGEGDGLWIFDYDEKGGSPDFTQPIPNMCRGAVFDRDLNLVALGFTKFWNLGEKLCDEIDWNTAVVERKFDGTMVLVFRHPETNRVVFTTRFQLPSEIETNLLPSGRTWGKMIREAIGPSYFLSGEGLAWVFEVMSDENEVVVTQGAPTAQLLMGRHMRYLDEIDHIGPDPRYAQFDLKAEFGRQALFEYVRQLPGLKDEGVVVRDDRGARCKVKGEEYIRLHRMVGRLVSRNAVIEQVLDGDYDEILLAFPRLRPRFEAVETVLGEIKLDLGIAYRKVQDLPSRKEQALALKEVYTGPFSGVIFSRLSGLPGSWHELIRTRVARGNVLEVVKKRLDKMDKEAT